MTDDGLAAAVCASLRTWIDESEIAVPERPTLVVAFSGGLDSCVLLHALRFGPLEAGLVAAHFDHRMRPGSRGDAAWVRGLCGAWGVPVETGVRGDAGSPPPERGDASAASADGDASAASDDGPSMPEAISEAEARRLRYDFLHAVRRSHAPAVLLTAHHADDQAETVLFRILRGTGIDGLSGIPAARDPGIVRPLLPFWRKDLEDYAHRHGLGWRDDPTNRYVGYARNLVRHRILPLAEEAMPGARRALVRLAEIAGEETAAWSEALERLEASLDVRAPGAPSEDGGLGVPPADADLEGRSMARSVEEGPAVIVSVDRDALASLGPGLRARVVRHLVRRHLGSTVHGREATERAVDFVAEGGSGRRIQLGGGLEMARALDRIELRWTPRSGSEPRPAPDRELVIEGASRGQGVARLAGCGYRVRWEEGSVEEDSVEEGSVEWVSAGEGVPGGGDAPTVVLPLDDLTFPLRVRSRRPGDRVSTRAGTRKLKKILLEARVPARRRDRLPVLVDGGGRVLWVPGVARASATPGAALRISIEPDDIDG